MKRKIVAKIPLTLALTCLLLLIPNARGEGNVDYDDFIILAGNYGQTI